MDFLPLSTCDPHVICPGNRFPLQAGLRALSVSNQFPLSPARFSTLMNLKTKNVDKIKTQTITAPRGPVRDQLAAASCWLVFYLLLHSRPSPDRVAGDSRLLSHMAQKVRQDSVGMASVSSAGVTAGAGGSKMVPLPCLGPWRWREPRVFSTWPPSCLTAPCASGPLGLLCSRTPRLLHVAETCFSQLEAACAFQAQKVTPAAFN